MSESVLYEKCQRVVDAYLNMRATAFTPKSEEEYVDACNVLDAVLRLDLHGDQENPATDIHCARLILEAIDAAASEKLKQQR